jgi:hypothetical protein
MGCSVGSENKPDEIGTWPSFARLVLQKQEEHDRAIAELRHPDTGFSVLRCSKHEASIEDFKKFLWKNTGIVSVVVVLCSILTPIILKKFFGV